MDARLDGMDKSIAEVKSDVAAINTHLEQVTDKNIQLIADGHLDLERNLNELHSKMDQFLFTTVEKEFFMIHLSNLESDITDVKKRLDVLEQTA